MKKLITLICAGVMAVSCAFAQTAPPVTPVVGATPAPAAGRPGRPPQTPEQIAAAKANADALNADHQNMMDQLHITQPLRGGKNGTDSTVANFANFDESKANPYPVW